MTDARQDSSELTEAPGRFARANPDLGCDPLSTEEFLSQEQFDLERDRVFRKAWINVGSVHDLRGPNSFFVRDIAMLGVSLLVIQDGEGAIRVFHNVCSHRHNKLVWEPGGSCGAMIACRFHGFGYDLRGKLVDVPDEANFYDLDKTEWGLVEVRSGTFGGFIFVNLDEEGSESLDEYLGPFADEYRGFPFLDLQLTNRYDIRERANWKVGLDAQNEIYHIPILAPLHRFLGTFFPTNEDGMTRLRDFRRYGRLHTAYSANADAEFAPKAVEAAIHAGNPDASAPKLPAPAPFVFNVLFPNMVIGFFGNAMFTYNFWPVTVNETVWEVRIHFPKMESMADRIVHEKMKTTLREAITEDVHGHAQVQVGLESRARKTFLLQDEEVQIRSFHKALADYIDKDAR